MLAKIDHSHADPWTTLELAPGAVELYYRSPETEEIHPVWVDGAERGAYEPDDIDRVTAEIADRWRTQRLEHDETLLVVGRYRIMDEVENVRPLLGSTTHVLEGEERHLVEALAAAAALLQVVPEDWLVPLAAAAEREGVGERIMARYCQAGRILGAHKRGRSWWLPRDFEVLPHPGRPRQPRRP